MIVVTPRMKTFFKKYWEIVSIDFTFKLIKEVHSSGQRWKLGFILGNSLSRRIVPFAILFVLEESSDMYYRLLRAFGNIMQKMPKVIVTD